MGWCPTVKAEVTEGTPEALRQPASAYTDHSLNDIGNHWGYENGNDYEMATRQPHWEKIPGRGAGRGSASNYQTPLIKKEDNGHTFEVYSEALQTHDNNPDAYQSSRGWSHLRGCGPYQVLVTFHSIHLYLVLRVQKIGGNWWQLVLAMHSEQMV